MIVQNRITIEDGDGDRFSIEHDDSEGGFFLLDETETRVLGIVDEDAKALLQFLMRYGVSA